MAMSKIDRINKEIQKPVRKSRSIRTSCVDWKRRKPKRKIWKLCSLCAPCV